jgi:hypothetical protein
MTLGMGSFYASTIVGVPPEKPAIIKTMETMDNVIKRKNHKFKNDTTLDSVLAGFQNTNDIRKEKIIDSLKNTPKYIRNNNKYISEKNTRNVLSQLLNGLGFIGFLSGAYIAMYFLMYPENNQL